MEPINYRMNTVISNKEPFGNVILCQVNRRLCNSFLCRNGHAHACACFAFHYQQWCLKTWIAMITVTQTSSHLPRVSASLNDGGLSQFLHTLFWLFNSSSWQCDQQGWQSCWAGCPHPALHSPLKVAMFSACALLQTTKSIMTPAFWAQTWHADMISAEKHGADCVGACCYNLILVFRPFSQDRQIFWDVSFSFYSPKPLRWPAQERDVKHVNSRTKQRQRELHLVLKCEWVGWDGHEEALAVTDKISLPWRVPVAIVAMFQHCGGTMCLGDQRFTQIHLSHSELVCFITA